MRPGSAVKVLIVEDQALLAMELDHVLTESGHWVVGCADDAAIAFALADEDRPQVALVDVNLRDGLTGPQIARQLIERHDTAVIFITANPEQIPEGFSGAIGVITKPFDVQTLKEVVDFAARFQRERTVTGRPARLKLAPWLLDPPPDVLQH